MAKRRVSGKRYRMTPKRRKKKKKAQAASAKKRRRSRVKNGLRAAGVIGVAVGTHVGTQAVYKLSNHVTSHPVQSYNTAKKAGAWARSKTRRGKVDLKPPAIMPKQPSNWKRTPGGGYLYNG